MHEEFLYFIWSHGLFDQANLMTVTGDSLQIFKPGRLNTHSGPDFSDAHIRISDTDWYGNIEIHVDADDWNKHGHQDDQAFNNVILHVVYSSSCQCSRKDGSTLPCLILGERISTTVHQHYEALRFSPLKIPCIPQLRRVPPIRITNAIDRAMVSRLERKSSWMQEWLQTTEGDWMNVFLVSLVRSFGFGINGDAFELLAMNLPVKEICKSEKNIHKINSIIFGIAGFLEESPNDGFQAKLRQEWLFQMKKLNLNHLDKSVFKFMRMRPGNFPSIRLAQLSAILGNFQELFNHLFQEPTIPTMLRILDIELDDYWSNHYQFGIKSTKHQCALSITARQTIIINAFVPFLFEFGKYCNDDGMVENAMDILRKLPPENNKFIRDWELSGIECTSAYDSQAMLELRNHHCDKRLCLHCPIGSWIVQMQD